jgi:DNA-binding CsgD family transcriptional regulator/tetratricopeptide (TPR) repeat protein
MIGRESELAELRALFDEALAGNPRVAVIGGEAGIGKSRLISEFTERAADDALVVVGQCVDFGAVDVPYAPLAGLLRGIVAEYGVESVTEAAGANRDTLWRLTEPERASGSKDDDSGVNRPSELLTALFERFAAVRPLVVVIEDLHWADPATLDVLRFAARVLTRGPIMIVLSYRSDDVGRGHPLRAFLAELERNRRVDRMTLNRLTPEQVREQAAALLGSSPSARRSAALFDRSEGVPFFVEELVCIDDDADTVVVPETLREILLARYETLEENAQYIMRALAAGGGWVDHDLLEEVVARPADELELALRAGVDAGVIVVVQGRGYAFRHALVRDAIVQELLPGESTRLHVRFAEALTRRQELQKAGPGRIGRAVLISHQWMEGHDVERAFATSIDAMALSITGFAYASAAQMGERALELWDRVPDAAAMAGMDHVDLLAKTAHSWRNAGEPQRSLAMIETALAEVDNSDGIALSRLLRDKATVLSVEGRVESVAVFEAALDALAPDQEPMLRANILAELAAQYMISDRPEEAIVRATSALEIAPADAPRSASIAANIRGGTLIALGRIDEGLADFARSRQFAEGDTPAQLRFFVNYSDTLHLLARYEESLAVASEGLALAREAGVERSSGAILAVNTVDPMFALGRWDEADDLIDASLDLEPPMVFRLYLRRAKLRSTLWRGDPDTAWDMYREWAARMSQLAAFEYQTRAGVANDLIFVALARGDQATATEFARALSGSRPVGSPGWELPLIGAASYELARRREAGDGVGASPDYADEETHLRDLLAGDAVWPTHGFWTAFVDAQLGGERGTGTDVDAWVRAAEAADSPTVAVLSRLLTRYGLARAQLESGDRSAATATCVALRAEADSIGAGLFVRWVDELMGRGGLAPARGGPPADRDAELTAREQQVLDLVAEGLSNGQIADRLYISRKTVSVHVSAILRKLGAASRTEAVRLSQS